MHDLGFGGAAGRVHGVVEHRIGGEELAKSSASLSIYSQNPKVLAAITS